MFFYRTTIVITAVLIFIGLANSLGFTDGSQANSLISSSGLFLLIFVGVLWFINLFVFIKQKDKNHTIISAVMSGFMIYLFLLLRNIH